MASPAELAMLLTLKNESAPGFAQAEKEVASFGSRVSSLGGMVATAVGGAALAGVGALAAGFAVGVQGASEMESVAARLQGQLGLTADEAQALGQVAETVFRQNFGESREHVASAITAIHQNIGELSPAATETAAASALALESLFEAPVNESTRAVGVMMKNFEGLSETQAFDLIAAGFQRGGNYSDELLDTLREYAPAFSTMGLSAEQAMGVLLAGANAGAWNLDKVGDAMKEFNIRAKDGSKATAEGFAAIGLNAEQMGADIAAGGERGERAFQATLAGLAAMEDPVKRNAAGVALFGTQWEDLESKVVLAMAEGLKGVEGYEGAAARAAATTGQGFSAAIEGLSRAVTGLLADAVMPILPHLTAFINLVAANLPGAFAAAQAAVAPFLPTIQSVIEALVMGASTAAGAIGALLTIFSGGEWDASMDAALESLVGIFGPEGAALITQFVSAAISAITAFAGTVTRLFQQVVDWTQANWPLIQQTITTVLGAISRFWSDHGERIIQIVSAVWTIVSTLISGALANLLDLIKIGMQVINGDWAGAWETLSGALARNLDQILTIVGAAFDALYALVDVATGGMLTSIETWMADTGQAISDGMTAVSEAITSGWEAIQTTVSNIMPLIANVVMAMWNALPEDIRADLVLIATHIVTQGAAWVTSLTTAGANMLTAITTALGNMVSAVVTWATSTFLAPITGLATSTGTAMTTAGSSMLTAITGKLGEIVGAVQTWASSTFLAPLQSLASSVSGTAQSIGTAIVNGIISGIRSLGSNIGSVLSGIVRGALQEAKSALGISSPSRLFAEQIGLPIAQGVALGIGQGGRLVDSALGSLVGMPSLSLSSVSGGSFTGGGAAPVRSGGGGLGDTYNFYAVQPESVLSEAERRQRQTALLRSARRA